jgi:hypothetical protein
MNVDGIRRERGKSSNYQETHVKCAQATVVLAAKRP